MVKNPPAVQEMRVQSLGWRCPGAGNGYPLQYSWLENSMDRGAWWASDHGVSELDTTKQLPLSFSCFIFTKYFVSIFTCLKVCSWMGTCYFLKCIQSSVSRSGPSRWSFWVESCLTVFIPSLHRVTETSVCWQHVICVPALCDHWAQRCHCHLQRPSPIPGFPGGGIHH